MHIIITGSTGFVGKNLIKYLENHFHKITCLNLRENDWINEIDSSANAIIHLAGKAHDTTNSSSDEEYFKINTDLTINLFEEFLKSEIRDFIYFSSVKAAADTLDSILYEDVVTKPLTAYGKSKLKAEEYLLARTLPSNKRIFIIRPCMIHGPGNKGNLNLLYNVVKKGIPYPLSAFKNKRSFLSVDNLSFLINEILLNNDISGGIYNFADDDALSTTEVVETIASGLGKKARLINLSPNFIKYLVKIGDIMSLPLNSERLKKLTENYVVSNSKIKKSLGIEKLPISVRQGLEITVKSFVQNK